MNRGWPHPRDPGGHSRGTKRTRSNNERPDESCKPSTSRSCNNGEQNNDDVDVPLSKRINRLNIEYQRQDQGPDLQQSETFQEKYPYDPNSPYYRNNELLYHLHAERSQRSQQAALHKALNSHLKL